AATLALPADGAGLDHVADELARVTHGCDQVHQRLEMVARAHRAWADAARRWTTAHGELIHATAREAEVVAQHEAEAMHLASLEDAVGADYEELLAALDASRAQLEATAIATKGTRAEKDEVTQAIGRLETDAENARSQAERLDQACVALLPGFRAALAV